jgi:GNAT superfamily N-acetyltransferase
VVGATRFTFKLNDCDCSVKTLDISIAELLQALYEKCADYNYLMEGRPPSATAALDEFTAIPEGKSLDDKHMLGIFDSQEELIGLIEGIQNYPESKCWWIGLIMLAPAHRCKGILYPLVKGFEYWMAMQGMDYVMGSVVETNRKVLRLWQQMGFEIVRKVEREQSNPKSHSRYVIRRKVGWTVN